MSSIDVPWPGSLGSSTANPADAKASARPRIDWGQPVNPCRTRAPSGPPGEEKGSAPGRTDGSGIGVLRGERLVPPVPRGGRWLRVLVDAVDGAHGHALAAARTELGDDDHVDAVVEDGAELRRTVPDARVAVDALRHLDPKRGQLPLRISLPRRDALLAGGRRHHEQAMSIPGPAVCSR